MKLPILIAMVLYMAIVVWIGVFYSRKTKTSEDYFLGGRGLGPWVTAMSAEASDMSSWLLMGLPGLAYATGFSQAGWTAIGLILGTYLNWKIVAKRLRHYTEVADNAITVPDFFSNRFKDDKKILSSISAAMILIFFTVYTASGFAACGTLFNSVFGLNYQKSMIVCAIVIVLYTSMGGFLAASTTDLIQGLLMSFAIVIVLIVGIVNAGGVANVVAHGQALDGFFDIMKYHDPATGNAVSQGSIPILSGLAWGLGYFGMPHVLLRFMAIEDEEKLKLSRRVASIWVVISLSVAVFIGIVGLSMTKAGAIETLTGSNSETIIVKIAHLLSTHGVATAIISGVILAGILAATMSTADSQLLAAASSISQNILTDVFHIKISKKASMNVARITVVIISVISIILASNPDSSVFEIVSFAWAGFGATFGPVVLCALFWKKANKYGITAGMISGGIMIFVWKYGISKLGGIFSIYELLPAFIVALLVIVIVSYATGGPSKEVIEKFEEVKNK